MARNINILEELKSLGAVKLLNNHSMPYHLPNTYWNTLEEWSKGIFAPSIVVNLPNLAPPYQVPDGYFNTFTEDMLAIVRANQLQDISKSLPYHVPQNYFEDLGNNLEQFYLENASVSEELNLISNLEHQNTIPFEVPSHYFDTLSDDILAQVTVEADELADSPLLASLKGSNPFEAPKFDNYDIPISTSADEVSIASNIINFEPKRNNATFIKRVAAGIAAIFVIGLGINIFSETAGYDNDALAASNITLKHELAADSILNSLSNESIEEYIAMNDEEFAYTYQTLRQDQSNIEENIDELLNHLSEEEIDDYLKYL